jgi:hypothetical protein
LINGLPDVQVERQGFKYELISVSKFWGKIELGVTNTTSEPLKFVQMEYLGLDATGKQFQGLDKLYSCIHPKFDLPFKFCSIPKSELPSLIPPGEQEVKVVQFPAGGLELPFTIFHRGEKIMVIQDRCSTC